MSIKVVVGRSEWSAFGREVYKISPKDINYLLSSVRGVWALSEMGQEIEIRTNRQGEAEIF